MPSLPGTLDLPSRPFRPLLYGLGAWTDNLPFAYDLVAALRPQLLVELGTDRGESYFAFCQSVSENSTGTCCVAVDTWRGDAQAGAYDETTFEEVSFHNRTNYERFSTLMRCSFDEALPHFLPESIGLLHLDGLHTEAAVRHDVEAWLPKLAPGAILLLHDVGVRRREFGVWRVWDELRMRGPSFTFTSGPGLGVWQKPPISPLPEPVETLLAGPDERADALAQYYRERARELHDRIAQQWRDGSIRQSAGARQTTLQIFHTHDGIHREEDSLFARVGHDAWKDISLSMPADAGAAPLRIDFLSPFTVIEVASIRLLAGEKTLFSAEESESFARLHVAGDAERLVHPHYLRLKITGQDPQLYLPELGTAGKELLLLKLRLRVVSGQ